VTITEKLTVALDVSEVQKLVEDFLKSQGYEIIQVNWDASNWRLKGCTVECKTKNHN
jgi:ribosome maturation factor RimP